MLLLSPSVVFDSLQPYGLQHTRLLYPSLPSGVRSNSCPLSWWCLPTILSPRSPPALKLSLDVEPSLEWSSHDGICAFIKRDITGLASSLSPMEGTRERPCEDIGRRQIPKTWKMEHFPAITVNKGCHSHQSLQPSYMSWWTLWKGREKKNIWCCPLLWILGKLRMWQ